MRTFKHDEALREIVYQGRAGGPRGNVEDCEVQDTPVDTFREMLAATTAKFRAPPEFHMLPR